jgi:hypothetical protein
MQNRETNKIDLLIKIDTADFNKKLEILQLERDKYYPDLVNKDGNPIPKHEIVFKIDELVVIKDYTYRVKYIGETAILFEPVGSKINAPAGERSRGHECKN